MADRDNVEVEIGKNVATGRSTAVITDRKGGRAWSGDGMTDGQATTDALKRMLGDRRAREYLE